MGSRLAGVEVHLPQRCPGSAEVEALGIGRDDCAVVAVHQVSLPHLEVFADRAGVPRDRLVVTVDAHGNAASAGLPLQLVTARAQGRCGPGDLVALVGPAGGVSLGLGVVEL